MIRLGFKSCIYHFRIFSLGFLTCKMGRQLLGGDQGSESGYKVLTWGRQQISGERCWCSRSVGRVSGPQCEA